MGEWRYSSTILHLGTRWRCVIGFTSRPLYPRGKIPGTNSIRGWVGPRDGLEAVERKKTFTLPEIEPRPSSS
jgi:hypothetical protein